MDVDKVNNLFDQIDKLEYESKRELYRKAFSLGYLDSIALNERLVLISLVSLTFQKMKQKDDSITPLQILVKITGQKEDNSCFYQFLESLAIIVEDFSYGITKFDACGLQSSQEIINKIKELLNTWMPF